MKNKALRGRLNPESNICLGFDCQTFKITKQQQNWIKNSFFLLVAGIWGLKSCNGFCPCWKRFRSAHVRETAFNIRSWKASGLPVEIFFFSLPPPQKVQMPGWVSGCSVGLGLLRIPGTGRAELFGLGSSHHPSSGAGLSWAWGFSLGAGWDISPWADLAQGLDTRGLRRRAATKHKPGFSLETFIGVAV